MILSINSSSSRIPLSWKGYSSEYYLDRPEIKEVPIGRIIILVFEEFGMKRFSKKDICLKIILKQF